MKKIKFTIVSSHSTWHLSHRYTLTIANIYCSMLRKSTPIKILGRVDITFLMKLIHQPPAPITMHNIPSWWDEYPGPFHNGQSLIFHIKQSWVVEGSFNSTTLKKLSQTQFEYYKAAPKGLILKILLNFARYESNSTVLHFISGLCNLHCVHLA